MSGFTPPTTVSGRRPPSCGRSPEPPWAGVGNRLRRMTALGNPPSPARRSRAGVTGGSLPAWTPRGSVSSQPGLLRLLPVRTAKSWTSTPLVLRIAGIVAAGVVAVLLFEIPGPAVASGAAYPVPYTLAAGIAAELLSPGASPPGANLWSCRPSPAHPEPVVLLHGLLGNMTDNWQTISPLLADNGYCVFALTYGTLPGATFPLDQFGGVVPMEQSAQTISDFVDRVLAATGAKQLDIVGHSEGATLPFYYAEFLNGAAKVHRYVGIAPVYHGTTLFGLASVASQLAVLFPSGAQAVAQICGSCQEFLAGSAFLQRLDANVAVPGVTYTNIMTRLDQAVVPYTSGMLAGPNVTNIVVQDQCGLDLSDHLALAADPIVARDVLNALDPSHAEVPICTLVLPFVG